MRERSKEHGEGHSHLSRFARGWTRQSRGPTAGGLRFASCNVRWAVIGDMVEEFRLVVEVLDTGWLPGTVGDESTKLGRPVEGLSIIDAHDEAHSYVAHSHSKHVNDALSQRFFS